MFSQLIEELKEAAEGFTKAKEFSKKIDSLINNNKEEFSPREVAAAIALYMAAWHYGQKDPILTSKQWMLLMEAFLHDMQRSKKNMAQF